jgi:nucleoside-diphosphate-sugar epimerase
MATVLLTGFPGFLGSELLPHILARSAGDRATCVVQRKFAALARARAGELSARDPSLAGRIELVEGDITAAGLGLGGGSPPRREVAEIYHLAAAYDLSVARDLGMKVNVQGTRNVLDFAERCPALRRVHYVSTCYVSGRLPGTFHEDDLVRGQTFNNAYEETKYLAEVELQERMKAGLPATIYRPAVVVGDAVSGATQKFDGPYFVIRWLLRQGRVAVLPTVGDSRASSLNLVPRDFVVAAIAYLSGIARSRGRVYHLADPEPLTVDALIDAIAVATGRRVLRVPLPLSFAKAAIDRVPGVYRLMQIPSSAIDYFVHPTRYATDRAREDLAPSGLAVPPLRTYLDRLVAFVRAHPEIGSQAMV